MKNLLIILFLCCTWHAALGQVSINVVFPHDGKIVLGTFMKPAKDGIYPTIIIAPGSGAHDRHGTIPLVDGNSACLFPDLYLDTLRIYKDLATALVDSGYAVLRYDKLEYTYANLNPITFHKLWLPVESAIEFVKNRTDVDTNRIILVGHSEGAMLIPFIARNRTDIAALISIAGARTPFDTLYARQNINLVELLRPCGATDDDSIFAASLANQVLAYFEIIRSKTWNTGTPALFGVPPEEWYPYINANDSVSINYDLNQLPALFLGMGIDLQVPPEELERFENEVTVTDDFWTIPGLTHFMTTETNPRVSEVLTDTIIYWLRQHHLNTSTDIPQRPSKKKFEAGPNPFTSTLYVKSTDGQLINTAITIRNAEGKEVYQGKVNGDGEMELGFLADGIYFIEIDGGDIIEVLRVVKAQL